MNTKICIMCKIEKSVDMFSKNEKRVYSYCKPCAAKRTRNWLVKNPEHAKEIAQRRRTDPTKIHRVWAKDTLHGHTRTDRKTTYTIDIKLEELIKIAKVAKFCPICGIELKWGHRSKHVIPGSPTLDRKDNAQTINKNNTWIICHKCNTMKSNNSMSELVAWCKMVVEKFDGVE